MLPEIATADSTVLVSASGVIMSINIGTEGFPPIAVTPAIAARIIIVTAKHAKIVDIIGFNRVSNL